MEIGWRAGRASPGPAEPDAPWALQPAASAGRAG
jgi:hypothetical protein